MCALPHPAPAKFTGFLLSFFLLIGSGLTAPIYAEDILLFGNSFTSANNIADMVQAIAVSKGKTGSTLAVTKGGQGFDYHLKQPKTDEALKSKPWDWVVLQDYSLNATHARKLDNFRKTGEAFYDRIAAESPSSKLLLYETWAYDSKHPIFEANTSDPVKFTDPVQMLSEIRENYAALQKKFQEKDPEKTVVIAPVGTAYALCVKEHPEINLYAKDFKHPNLEGSYLSALVLYATLYNDSPIGAAPGRKVDPAAVKALQEVAAQATGKK